MQILEAEEIVPVVPSFSPCLFNGINTVLVSRCLNQQQVSSEIFFI